jgi:hypothetical protein
VDEFTHPAGRQLEERLVHDPPRPWKRSRLYPLS